MRTLLKVSKTQIYLFKHPNYICKRTLHKKSFKWAFIDCSSLMLKNFIHTPVFLHQAIHFDYTTLRRRWFIQHYKKRKLDTPQTKG